MNEIADRLAAIRALGDVSQQELGKLAGLSPRAVGMIEQRGQISGRAAASIAPVVGTTADYLLGGPGTMPAKRTVRRALTAARGAFLAAGNG